jgi:hypothetical protein
MSVGYAKIKSTKKGKLMKLMCVFCETIFENGTFVCTECKDYKGLMSLGSAITYLELDPTEYAEYVGYGHR